MKPPDSVVLSNKVTLFVSSFFMWIYHISILTHGHRKLGPYLRTLVLNILLFDKQTRLINSKYLAMTHTQKYHLHSWSEMTIT